MNYFGRLIKLHQSYSLIYNIRRLGAFLLLRIFVSEMRKASVFIVIAGLVLVGCKKPITEPNSGIYRGTFLQIYDETDTNAQGVAVVALSKDGFGGTFSMSGDTATGAPYSCYGDYSIDNSSQITFTNKAIVEVGYQPHYLLDTTYDYTFDDHNFTLDLVIDTVNYQYTLVRN